MSNSYDSSLKFVTYVLVTVTLFSSMFGSKNTQSFGLSALCPNWLKMVFNGANQYILSWFTI